MAMDIKKLSVGDMVELNTKAVCEIRRIDLGGDQVLIFDGFNTHWVDPRRIFPYGAAATQTTTNPTPQNHSSPPPYNQNGTPHPYPISSNGIEFTVLKGGHVLYFQGMLGYVTNLWPNGDLKLEMQDGSVMVCHYTNPDLTWSIAAPSLSSGIASGIAIQADSGLFSIDANDYIISKKKGVKPEAKANPCECGAHATFMKDNHSSWCPSFKRS